MHQEPHAESGTAGVLASRLPAETGRLSAELAIIVPTLNERDNVGSLVDALEQALPGVAWEVIFVDDDSPDGTADAVRALARRDARVRCLQRIARRGLSSACIEGMLASAAPYLAVMDADLQHDEGLLPELYARLRADEVDLVVASRYMAGASTGDLAGMRVRISRLACWLSRLVLKTELTDPMSGFFVLRRELLERAVHRLYGRGFKILLDLFASTDGQVRFVEVPYRMRARRAGESKLGFQVILDYLMLLINKLFGRLVPARFFLFGAVGLSGVAVHLGVLAAVYRLDEGRFVLAQIAATWAAMTSNFLLNNLITFRDRRLVGLDMLRGLLSFYLTCGVGAVLSVALGEFLHQREVAYWLAGLGGALVAAVWNFMLSSSVTWSDAAPAAAGAAKRKR